MAAVVVAEGLRFVGGMGGRASFGLGGAASAGVEGRTGTRPAQGGLQGAGRRDAGWKENVITSLLKGRTPHFKKA